jgi:hypothetical protein
MHVRRGHQFRDCRDFRFAAEEWGQRRWEMPGSLIGGDREVDIVRQIPMNENEDAFGALEVTEAHLADFLETPSRWQAILCQLLDGLGHQDLATTCHAEQTRQTVERSGEIIPFSRFGLAGVDCHAGPQGSELVGPGLCEQRQLSRKGRAERGRRRGKGGLRAIADRLEEDTPVRAGRFA